MIHLNVYMGAEGDSFRIMHDQKELTKNTAREIHPIIEQMLCANTRETVVQVLQAFRKEAKNQGNANNYWSAITYGLQSIKNEEIEIILLHVNAPAYRGHTAHPGVLHSDCIEKMIAFADGSDREPTCNIF